MSVLAGNDGVPELFHAAFEQAKGPRLVINREDAEAFNAICIRLFFGLFRLRRCLRFRNFYGYARTSSRLTGNIQVTFVLLPNTATTILDGLAASNDHNSGKLIIGPDLKLYYSIGDQGANQFSNACNHIQSQDLPTTPSDYDAYKGKITIV